MRTNRTGRLLATVTVGFLAVGCAGEDTGGAILTDGTAPVRPGGATSTTVGAPGSSQPGSGTSTAATLSGREEVPGPGDPDGAGTASLSIDPTGKLCARLVVSGIDEPTAAHVHTGAAGLAGPVLFPLPTPATSSAGTVGEGCTTATREQMAQVLGNPSGFYVNVHTKAFPNGAVRGQLGKT